MNLSAALPVTTPQLPSGPRERALHEGVGALGDAELLAILLGTGLAGRPVNLVAAALLDRFGGLDRISRLSPDALAEHPGVGMAKALRIAAALEMGKRAWRRPMLFEGALGNSEQVAAYMGPSLAALDHEEMWMLCLDGRNRLRGARKVAQGGLHGCSVSASDILRCAIQQAATSFVLVHNHPGGDSRPSPEDVAMTRQVSDAGAIVGLPLVDHVIVTPAGNYCSLLDLGVLVSVA